MIHLLNVEEWAERYHNGDMLPEELQMLHKTLEEDKVLNTAFEQALQMQVLLKDQQKRSKLKSKLAQAAALHRMQSTNVDSITPSPNKGNKVWMNVKRFWKPLSAAAMIAVCSSLFTYTLTKDNKTKNNQYVLLKRDIESIKKSQNQIINNMKQSEANAASTPVAENIGNFAGSGFAISNDGYFATNYHVVEKADSVYLQMNNGKSYKAAIIKVNPEADLAILKIVDKNFTFKQSVPYTIDKDIAMLGQRIFSIGYPKDEVVYNEGYISSEKGYDGNTLAYQLEITANPGQSGAPILDIEGNVVGIITGKQNNTSGTTFAVHAEQLTKMIAELPKDKKINLNTKNRYANNTRPEQVKTLRDYVCAVRVY